MSDLNPKTSLFSHYQFPSHSRKSNTQMSETKDPVIKLFGKTIQIDEISNSSLEIRDREDLKADKETSVNTPPTPENCAAQDAIARTNDNPKTPSIYNETTTLKSSRTEDDHSDPCVSKEKTLKKPDKVVLCPRCNSMDTKFCYYNNYNISQPRHFCKKCQRYWTAGGTMRNVHVGAGRRKNKNSVSHFRHLAISEDLQTAQPNLQVGIHHSPTFRPNDMGLASASSLCESMELNLATQNFNAWNIPYTPRTFSHERQTSICHPKASLGKHTRDDADLVQASNTFEEGTSERRLWIPKTIRIDDPKEAVKSSIWETLGIKNETGNSMEWRGGVFKAFQSNGHEKNHTFKTCPVSNSNPAAMCRSLNFQESS